MLHQAWPVVCSSFTPHGRYAATSSRSLVNPNSGGVIWGGKRREPAPCSQRRCSRQARPGVFPGASPNARGRHLEGGDDMTQDPVLAALARLEEGQKQLREQLGLVANDQAVLFDALNTLPARVDGLKIAMAPTLERLDRLDLLLRGLADQVREKQA